MFATEVTENSELISFTGAASAANISKLTIISNECEGSPESMEIYYGLPAVVKYVLYFTLWAALRAFNSAPGKFSRLFKSLPAI